VLVHPAFDGQAEGGLLLDRLGRDPRGDPAVGADGVELGAERSVVLPILAAEAKISDMSTGSTVIPVAWRSFSLQRTVRKAAGRVPIWPIRRVRRPLTVRQIAAKRWRSTANSAEETAQVCLRCR
jgi:hypothetical protein